MPLNGFNPDIETDNDLYSQFRDLDDGLEDKALSGLQESVDSSRKARPGREGQSSGREPAACKIRLRVMVDDLLYNKVRLLCLVRKVSMQDYLYALVSRETERLYEQEKAELKRMLGK